MLQESWSFIEMAKQNLDALIQTILNRQQSIAEFRKVLNLSSHEFIVDTKDLWNEIYIQLSGIKVKEKNKVLFMISQDRDLIKKLQDLVDTYALEMFEKASSTKEVRGVSIEIGRGRTPANFSIIGIAPANNSVDIFRLIKDTFRAKPLNRLQKNTQKAILSSNLYKKLIEGKTEEEAGHITRTIEKRTVGREYTTSTGVTKRSSGMLEGGHSTGSSVAEKWLNKQVNDLGLNSSKALPARVYRDLIKMGVLSAAVTRDTEDTKKIVFYYDQGTHANKAQSTIENKLADSLAKVISNYVNSLGADYWANFPTSPSKIRRTKSSIVKRALKSKNAKAINKSDLLVDNTPSKAKARSKPLQAVNTIKTSKDSIQGKLSTNRELDMSKYSRDTSRPEPETYNWNQLLPLINSKLTPRVIANMKFPALVNRTGTFANSAEILSVESTKDGYPSFVFDYERDPYNVFDRTLGRSPWNTPQRDPSALVDKSVREIVREMAIGRFYTRRA